MERLNAVTENITYGGSAVAIIGGLTATQIAALGGLVIAVLSFALNAFFSYRRDRRDRTRLMEERSYRANQRVREDQDQDGSDPPRGVAE